MSGPSKSAYSSLYYSPYHTYDTSLKFVRSIFPESYRNGEPEVQLFRPPGELAIGGKSSRAPWRSAFGLADCLPAPSHAWPPVRYDGGRRPIQGPAIGLWV
jgi:hypothetical protein